MRVRSAAPAPAAEDEVHRLVESRLGASRQRYSTSRRALVELMAGAGRPISIGEILSIGAGTSQSSLYRNLTMLEETGVVRRLPMGDCALFELDEELTAHHHHLICSVCGTVLDVYLDARAERDVARALARAAHSGGFHVSGHRLDVLGVCGECEPADAGSSCGREGHTAQTKPGPYSG